MNRQSVNRSQVAALSVHPMVYLVVALVLTLAAGLFYHSVQTARLADQVAAQTALLAQLRTTHANTLVRAAQPLPATNASPATVERIVPQERWVF
ncbi:hypothetical protein ACE1YR_03220 [Pseudomonas sp. K1(2024)]|uniref:Uncharacterized protein n=1 Tax=Pseudomonas boreofloridensis TaxID=3064348 RepID=A0ABV4Z475_9PSED|nr:MULTISPECIES: hypothetical protein [Pseudomonas]AIZ34851.1 hypothetical protein NJ69_18510 [Pseudomonas parafulva]MDO7900957.1 hypothetical protein [Pseudomonas sp. K13]MDV9033762.1 hypothetical protein [Pseudomonas sp. RAC1]